jgi:hypothetical protein
VGPSGQLDVTNSSLGSTDVSVSVMGYFSMGGGLAAGDTYVGVPESVMVDTRSGVGAPKAQLAAGASLTVQVAGQQGVPSDAVGVSVFVGAANGSAAGYLDAYPSDQSDPGMRVLSYQAQSSPVRNLFVGGLSASPAGELTVVNEGSAPVDVILDLVGYFVGPTNSEAGETFIPLTPSLLQTSTQLAANGSLTFTALGVGGVPTAGVSEVAQSVEAVNPVATGWLTVYATGGTASGPVVNFVANDSQDNDLDTAMLSAVSPTGQETIVNNSSGTVSVIVTLRGYFASPAAPSAPLTPYGALLQDGSDTAVITWAQPVTDGGASITGYQATIYNSDGSVNQTLNTGSTTYDATATNLNPSGTYSVGIAAVNSVGSGAAATSGLYVCYSNCSNGASPPAGPQTLSGQVVASNGQPVASDDVALFATDPPTSSTTSWTAIALGTVTTNSSGQWSFTLPAYSGLPSGAQQLANNDNGYLDVLAQAHATATANGTIYLEYGDTIESGWVGTSTTTGAVSLVTPTAQTMTLEPQPGSSFSQDTTQNENATWAANNSPTAVDGNDNVIGDGDHAYTDLPVDNYGYQEIGGNSTFDPNIASDGTDLSQVSASPDNPDYCGPAQYTVLSSTWSYTVVGEHHASANSKGGFLYANGASSQIGDYTSQSGTDWTFSGFDTFATGQTLSQGPEEGPSNGHQVVLALAYQKDVVHQWCSPGRGPNDIPNTIELTWYVIKNNGLYNPGNGFVVMKDGADVSKYDSRTYWLDYLYGTPQFINTIPVNYGFSINKNQALTYGFSASVFGIGVTSQTTHSTSVTQSYAAGTTSTDDHFVWGDNGPYTSDPKVVYNYDCPTHTMWCG